VEVAGTVVGVLVGLEFDEVGLLLDPQETARPARVKISAPNNQFENFIKASPLFDESRGRFCQARPLRAIHLRCKPRNLVRMSSSGSGFQAVNPVFPIQKPIYLHPGCSFCYFRTDKIFHPPKPIKARTMALQFRLTQPGDFAQCFDLAHERFLFETAKSRAELLAFWRKTLADRSALSSVVLDDERPKNKNLVGFCFYAYTSDDFAREAQSTLPPFFILQILRRWKRGSAQNPLLSRKALARHNAMDGLNLTVLHYGVEPRESFELEVPVRVKIVEAYGSLHGGFQLKQYLHEVYGEHDKEIMEKTGCPVRRDYAEFAASTPWVKTLRPFMTGINREETLKKPGVPTALFVYSPPRFGFTPGEQDVLEKAFVGEIDRDIAPALNLTIWAIKKRWQSIYMKVEKAEPSILGPMGDKNDEEYQKTRRRFLLDYLRGHQEELRPYAPSLKPKIKKAGK
jgi:hypothetical protein